MISFVLNIFSKFVGKSEVYICVVRRRFYCEAKKKKSRTLRRTSNTCVRYASHNLILTALN